MLQRVRNKLMLKLMIYCWSTRSLVASTGEIMNNFCFCFQQFLFGTERGGFRHLMNFCRSVSRFLVSVSTDFLYGYEEGEERSTIIYMFFCSGRSGVGCLRFLFSYVEGEYKDVVRISVTKFEKYIEERGKYDF